jgi:endonuclease/exonuclease/phosphatase (EEP) superfamily protein YafD
MKFLRALLYLLAMSSLAVVLLGYFGQVHASLDSLAHFRLHFAVLAAVFGLVLMPVRRKAFGFLVIFSALIPLFSHMDEFGGASPRQLASLIWDMLPEQISEKSDRLPALSQPAGPRYRLLHANLRFDNPDPKGFLKLAGEAGADVITLNEVSQQWLPLLETLKSAYPHQLVCSADSKIGGVAILSKRPFADDPLNGCSDKGVLAFQLIDFGGRTARIGTAHLLWPWPHLQPLQLSGMRARMVLAGDAAGPLMFAGDLNAAPWSFAAKRIARYLKAPVITIAGGSWLYHTLPARYIIWTGLPIDNVFTRSVTIVSAARGAPFGSDHLPAIVEFEIVDTPKQETKTVLAN